MSYQTYSYKTMIREHHLDSFGHVNNATYLQLLEEARWEWISNRGFGLDDIHKLKQGPVILEINIRFKQELQNRKQIRIDSQVQSYQGKICKLQQVIYNDREQIAAEADLIFGLFDLQTRKLLNPTAEWLNALGLNAEA